MVVNADCVLTSFSPLCEWRTSKARYGVSFVYTENRFVPCTVYSSEEEMPPTSCMIWTYEYEYEYDMIWYLLRSKHNEQNEVCKISPSISNFIEKENKTFKSCNVPYELVYIPTTHHPHNIHFTGTPTTSGNGCQVPVPPFPFTLFRSRLPTTTSFLFPVLYRL